MLASIAWLWQGLVLLVVGTLLTRLLWPLGKHAVRRARATVTAPRQLESAVSYMTHLRDGVMPAVWRAQERPDLVRSYIRQNILEPIRGYVTTRPGEQIKVVWFRPEEGNTLSMCEQVGHTPEGQGAMRLAIGVGIAGRAFSGGETVYCADCESDVRFQEVPQGHRHGSLVCVPIQRAGETTGVLSVWSTCKDAFRLADFVYFEGLAAAIASLEVFERPV